MLSRNPEQKLGKWFLLIIDCKNNNKLNMFKIKMINHCMITCYENQHSLENYSKIARSLKVNTMQTFARIALCLYGVCMELYHVWGVCVCVWKVWWKEVDPGRLEFNLTGHFFPQRIYILKTASFTLLMACKRGMPFPFCMKNLAFTFHKVVCIPGALFFVKVYLSTNISKYNKYRS